MDAARKVGGEQHRFLQFLRFTKALPDLYVADIAPAYDVLALIVPHCRAVCGYEFHYPRQGKT